MSILYYPIAAILAAFHAVTTSWALAIILLVLLLRLLLFPIFRRQIALGDTFAHVSARMKEIREEHKDNPAELQSAMADLTAEHSRAFNSVFTFFIQGIVLFGIYRVLTLAAHSSTDLPSFVSGLTKGHLFSSALSLPLTAPSSSLAEFSTTSSAQLSTGVVLLVLSCLFMAVTSYFALRRSARRTATPLKLNVGFLIQLLIVDGIFVYFALHVHAPLGVLLYWVGSNLFSLAAQVYALHRIPPTIPPRPAPPLDDSAPPADSSTPSLDAPALEERTPTKEAREARHGEG